MAPPTINPSGGKDPRKHDRRPAESILCRVKFCNTLPDVPFDPKFLIYPFESQRFVRYHPTALERSYRHELLTEHDLGVAVDLVNPDAYRCGDVNAMRLDPKDERLLEEDSASGGAGGHSSMVRRSRHHNKNVSWLRKTEYISREFSRWVPAGDKAESRIGFNVKKQFKEDNLYQDRDSQIEAIQKTFEAASAAIGETTGIQHYSKAGVTAAEVLPVFPDFHMWQHPCAQVIFDTDPTVGGGRSASAAAAATSATGDGPEGATASSAAENQAMIRGMVDETGEQFVAYFLPTEETRRKRKRDEEASVAYQEEETYDYELTREYNWNVKNKTMRGYEENYFVVFREDGVYYNELETRVRLSKRRRIGAAAAAAAGATRTRLEVRHREFTDPELKAQTRRLTMLEVEGDEEEDEEEEEDEVEEETPAADDDNVAAADDLDGGAEDASDAESAGVEEQQEEEEEQQEEGVAEEDSDGVEKDGETAETIDEADDEVAVATATKPTPAATEDTDDDVSSADASSEGDSD